jgi:hypothetical protein
LNDTVKYVFTFKAQLEDLHKELFQISVVKNVCKSMTKEGQFRNLTVMLPEEVSILYTDEQRNFVFRL